MAPMTIAASFGAVMTIRIIAPIPSKVLRRAIDAVAPTADLIWVVSAVRRDTSSPVLAVSKKSAPNKQK